MSISDFMKLLKPNKELIFHTNDIPKNNQMGQLYVVAL